MSKESIGILTYPVRHRKTYDLLSLLSANGYTDVCVYSIPFHYQKKRSPVVEHRPGVFEGMPELGVMCENLNYKLFYGQLEEFEIDPDRVILVAGAGILPKSFYQSHIVINAHPGYIPNCRGLDAYKWAIYDREPIGVSTHLIGDEIDAGMVIERRVVELFPMDTFHSVARRVYENEVSMLVEAIEKYDRCDLQEIAPNGYTVHGRMPEVLEKELFQKFEEYKKWKLQLQE